MAPDAVVRGRKPTDASSETRRCGLCERPVIRIQFSLNGHRAEVRTCSLCEWRVLLVDGAPVTKDDLLGGMRPDHWAPPVRPAGAAHPHRLSAA
jgi:hypothetical protein